MQTFFFFKKNFLLPDFINSALDKCDILVGSLYSKISKFMIKIDNYIILDRNRCEMNYWIDKPF